jgi:hypothetical protein
MNPFKSLGKESLSILQRVVKEAKATAEQRLLHLAVRETATAKDPAGLTVVIARHAGHVDGLDNLLQLIYDAERTA